MSFDGKTNRIGTNSSKWDLMEPAFGVPAEDGLAMWVADKDFAAPDFLQDAVQALKDRADYGYFCGLESYYEAVCRWMKERHGWQADPDWMTTTFGLGNAIAMALQVYSAPGDHVAIFTPVYHEFTNKIGKTGRKVTELPLAIDTDGLYYMDFGAYDARMTGQERILLISSPHNPAGRVWTQDELDAMAAFCIRHDLILISDEIHMDLVFEGHRHIPTHVALPLIEDRLIVTTAASKTFSIAGLRTGIVTIPDAGLRERFMQFHRSLDMSPNLFGVRLTEAAYSPEGAAYVDRLVPYLAGNRDLFNAGVNDIPGLRAMPMQSTYLAWVDFSGTGMDRDEFQKRVYQDAKIAASPGQVFGSGGESCMRFNLGTQRVRVEEAVSRLASAFSDLQ